MKKSKKIRNNMEKKIFSLTLSSVMIFGTCSSAFAAPLAKLPSISDNSLVIGKNLFELDKVNSSQYNLNAFVEAAKTVDDNNGVYYKLNGKWYTAKDIESLDNFKNAKGLDSIPNDILKINGSQAKEQVKPAEPAKPETPTKPQKPVDVIYKDGEYEGEGNGFKSLIKVKVTIKDHKISNINIIEENDTPGFFKQAKAIIGKMLKEQSQEVDVISNATFSSKGIKEAVGNALKKAKINNEENIQEPTKPEQDIKKDLYIDGEYEGEGQGFASNIKVKVTIKDSKISNIDIIETKDTQSYFNRAKAIIGKILSKQSQEVDHISGATYSSKGIKEAVGNALKNAKVSQGDNNTQKPEEPQVSTTPEKPIENIENNKNYPVTIDNYNQVGEKNKVMFAKKPNRVITTNQSATELLLTLGLEDYMVGTACADNSILPSLMGKYKKIPILAQGYPKPEVAEKQNPDFIMGWNSAFKGYGVGFTENWNKKGVATFIQRNTIEKSQTIDNGYKDIEDIGKIFDIEDKTTQLIQSMKNKIDDIQDKVKKVDKEVKVMAIEIEKEDSYYAYGKNNLVNDMIEKAGAVNIGDGYSWYGSDIAYENPDAILVIRYNGQDEEKSGMNALKKVDALKDINAIKNNKVIEVGLADIYPGGVRMADVIERLAKTFYPEIFNNSGNTDNNTNIDNNEKKKILN